MTKPFQEFGGWLRFFYLINIIGISVAAIFLIIILPIYGKIIQSNNTYSLFFFIHFIEILSLILIAFFMTRKMALQEPSVPNKIVRYLILLVGTSFIFTLIREMITEHMQNTSIKKDLQGYKELIGLSIYGILWILYFKKSKRVQVYYRKQSPELPPK